MRYGEIIIACRLGFYIEPSLLKPIRISENSNCWGLFIKGEEEQGNKDLIISPFPYRSWPCLVKLQIRIKKENCNKSILKILDTLKTDFNILALDIMFVDHCHYMLSFVVEVTALRSLKDTNRDTVFSV